MKQMIACILFSLFTHATLAQNDAPFVLQLKYSPLGIIDADEDEFDRGDRSYEKYDMEFERTLGAKIIFSPIPIYLGVQQSITNLDNSMPDAKVETLAVGFGGLTYDEFAYDSGIYLMGSVGAGAGRFKFKQPELDDWEALVEGNAEIGLRIQEHMLLGVGVDYQHFGEPGESKANFWNLYIGTGLTF
jgi:hypothetical protein